MVYCRYTYAVPLVSDSFTPLVPFFRFVYKAIFQGELRVKKQRSAAGGKANYRILNSLILNRSEARITLNSKFYILNSNCPVKAQSKRKIKNYIKQRIRVKE